MWIQSLTAIFLFPGVHESSIYSPHVSRMSAIMQILNVRFRLHTMQISSTGGNGINNKTTGNKNVTNNPKSI